MSIIKSISNVFSKKQSSGQLGISLYQHALSFFYFDGNDQQRYQKIELDRGNENSHAEILTTLIDKEKLSGTTQLILPVSQYQIVQIDKPNVPDNEIAAALKWQVKELVTFAPENMVVDYFDGPVASNGISRINVVCASKIYLTEIMKSLDETNLALKNISTEEFAFASLLPVEDDATLLVCQQPNEEAILLIVKQGKLFFHRRLRGYTQLSTQTEEQLSMGSIDSLSLEIQRSTDYFERQLKHPPIKNIKVILPVNTENYIVQKLSENTNIPVSLLPLTLGNIKNSEEPSREVACALGATQLTQWEHVA